MFSMTATTKKDFKADYKANRLTVLQYPVKMELKEFTSKLRPYSDGMEIPAGRATTSFSVDNQGGYSTIMVYSVVLNKVNCYIVHELIDNSKCSTCSWNTQESWCSLFRINH